jgi:hypothetical protein
LFSFFVAGDIFYNSLEINMGKPIKAYGGNGAAVIYEYANKTGVIRCGGKIGWRSTNPGNIKVGSYAREFGSIGNNGQFAIFPDFSTGRRAIYNILRKPIYRNVTLGEAINVYAPPKENDTEEYIKFITDYTPFDRTDPMVSIDNWLLVDVIIKKEGYLNTANQGEVKFIPDVTKKNKYRWRTRKDIVVRKEHRGREGEEFYWDNPPEGGHPGEAYGCRCWAEAFEYDECFEKSTSWSTDPASQVQAITMLTLGLSELIIGREIDSYIAKEAIFAIDEKWPQRRV